MYNEIIAEHFMNPRNIGELASPDLVIKIGNAVCGDTIILHVAHDEEMNITDVKVKAYGCATSIATASVFSDYIRNRNIREVAETPESEISVMLGELEPNQMHCQDILKALFAQLANPEGKTTC